MALITMETNNMNPVDRINLVAMRQDRKLHEKRCEVRELEKLKKELEKTCNALKEANEKKQGKLDKKKAHNSKMRQINERFKNHVKLIDEHNELLQERNIMIEETWSKELTRYEDMIKTYEQKAKEHVTIYEQFPYVREQKEWLQKLRYLKLQVTIEQTKVQEQKNMNKIMCQIQRNRLNNSIIQFVKRVVDLWKYYNDIERAKNQKQYLIVRLNTMKEKISTRQSSSMQLTFEVPQSFLTQIDNVTSAIKYSSTISSLKMLESNLMSTLSKFTTNIKGSAAPDLLPHNQVSPSYKRKRENSLTNIHKSNNLIKKLCQITTQKNIDSNKETTSLANNQQQIQKLSNINVTKKISPHNNQQEKTAIDSITNQISPKTVPNQNNNVTNENKSSPVVLKRKSENSDTNIKANTSIQNIKTNQQAEASSTNDITRQTEVEQMQNVTPITRKVQVPQILNIEIIKPPEIQNNADPTSKTSEDQDGSSANDNQNVNISNDELVRQNSQTSLNQQTNYDLDIASARFHMSSILEKSPEYPSFTTMEGFVSPKTLSSDELEIAEVTTNISKPSTTTEKATFSIFGKKTTEKKDSNIFFGSFFNK